MKYRVSLTWKKEEVVEADNREDAINQVLHNGKKPQLRDSRAWVKEHPANQTTNALARYGRWFGLRKAGKSLREIAESETLHISTIHKGILKYESHILTLKIAA